jgi:hypothetical protein
VAATWTWLLADLRTNVIIAEVPLTGGRPSKRLGASGTLSGSFPVAAPAPAGSSWYAVTRPARTAIYALRDGAPWWGGIVWTSRYRRSTGTVELGAADWWSYFDHRKVLPILSSPSVTDVAQETVAYSATDQNEIARNLVTLAQSHTGGDIGIVLDTSTSGTTRDRTYEGYDLIDTGQALKNLSQVQGGPDLMFDVLPTLPASGRPVRILRIGTPTLGQSGSPHVFEYGANVLDYDWPSDGTRMATRAYAVGSGSERGALIAVAEDTDRYGDGWPMLEADAAYSTVSESDTLQGHADADQAAARLPVVIPTLLVRGDGTDRHGRKVGPSIGDYAPGDDARVVIDDADFFGGQPIDTTMRLVGVDVDPYADGGETAELVCNPVLDDVA